MLLMLATACQPKLSGRFIKSVEPTQITNNDSSLIGVLRDGYAVFGQKCPADGNAPGVGTPALDTKNGHTADTKVSGLGTIYHYHLGDMASDGVSEVVITDRYHGTPGTMSNN